MAIIVAIIIIPIAMIPPVLEITDAIFAQDIESNSLDISQPMHNMLVRTAWAFILMVLSVLVAWACDKPIKKLKKQIQPKS